MAQNARSRLAVTIFSLSLITSFVIGACSGAEFSQSQAAGAGGGTGAGASGGRGGVNGGGAQPGDGGTVLCSGPDECDDLDPCTVDTCGEEGSCVHSAKCTGGLLCCDDGGCGQCCEQTDCVNDVACIAAQCFNRVCAYVPDDDLCAASEYCHTSEGCKDRELCPNGTVEECEDDEPCTADSCEGSFCDHEFCSGGQQCCPDVGCAACCEDFECQDDDPCTKEVCSGGQCVSGELCEAERCCATADGATCGACCSQDDCADDFECTEDTCNGGECGHAANNNLCEPGQICDPGQGCIAAADCLEDVDCVSADPCGSGSCVQGTCVYTSCPLNQHCCDGVCQNCCTRDHCGGVASSASAVPPPGDCQSVSCVGGFCQTDYYSCTEACCAPFGCCSLDF